MKKVLLTFVAFLSVVAISWASVPLYTGPQDVPSLLGYLNSVVNTINSPSAFGNGVANFAGLQFALAQGGVGAPSGSMTGYVQGDSITLQCTGVTFAVSPVVGAVGVSGGAVTQGVVVNPGVTSGAVPSGSVACTQASTSGSGAGYQVTAALGVIASYISLPSLSTGSAASSANGNFFLNMSPTDNASYVIGGTENLFIGDKAGAGFSGSSSYNTGIGLFSCGGGGTNVGSHNTCLSVDAGRNISGNVGSNVMLGDGAGRNVASSNNVFIGSLAVGSSSVNNAGLVTGGYNVAIGYSALNSLSTANQTTAVGSLAGSGNNGGGNVFVGYNSSSATGSNVQDTFIGYQAGKNATGGFSNVLIGWNVASSTYVNGSNDIIIGANLDTLGPSTNNEINIGGLLFYNNNSTAAPAVSACGASPSIDAHANNRSGTVTVGTGATASCTVTFAGTGYATWNHCRVTPQTASLVAFGYSYTTTVLTVTGTSITSAKFDYDCDGY